MLILSELAHGDMVVRSAIFENQSSENTLLEILTEISDSVLISALHKPWLVGLRFYELKYNSLKSYLELVSVACNQRTPNDAKIGNWKWSLHVMVSNKLLVE